MRGGRAGKVVASGRLDGIPIIADVVFGVDKLAADSIRRSLYYPMGQTEKLKN